MTARVAIWAAGLGASVVLNAALAGLVWLSIRPAPIAEQAMPQTRIDVQAHRLDRTEARPAEARGNPARTAPATGAPLSPGAIAKARAKPVAAPAGRLAPADADAARLDPQAARPSPARPLAAMARPLASALPQPARLTTVPPRPRPALAQARPQAAVLTTAPPRPHPAAALVPASRPASLAAAAPAPAAALRPAVAVLSGRRGAATAAAALAPAPDRPEIAPPPAQPAAPSAPQSARAQAAPPDPVAAPRTELVAQPAPRAAANARRLKAALAFSAAGQGEIDPVSLSAFQSFMHPGDAAARTDTLRDGVAGLLAQVPCSRLQVGFDPDTATLRVNGHIPEDGLRAPVLAALGKRMGADIAISDNMLILPRPQCGALSGIAALGLPQSTDQITNPLLIGRKAHARVFRFTRGDLLALEMTAPDYAAHVYLDYFDAAGNVLHLEPNEFAPLRLARPGEIQTIGARAMHDTGLRLVVGPPYGQEIAVAFAASAPLYDGLRPISEPAAPYLDWLKGRIALARKENPGFKGEWVYFFVRTSPN